PEPEKPKPKPYALKVRSRTPSGSGIAYVVQGTDRGRMQQEVALDAFVSCFPEAAPDRPLEKASKKALSQWADLASQYITAAKTETDEQGMVVTFQADLGKLRKTLQARGYASSPVVPSFKVNTNGSYAPDDVVISSVGEGLKSASSFFVGTAAYATPEGLEREIGKLKVSIDGEPYSVKVASKKDFGSSAVGQSIMYFIDVLPSR
ncbi:MAG: hypothetical protein AB1405_13845, partial [Bdellovibrionota bacterium]